MPAAQGQPEADRRADRGRQPGLESGSLADDRGQIVGLGIKPRVDLVALAQFDPNPLQG